ncbi:endolytic transglycosylase MltG [Aceticella autotrophica]|uniref:Endolytic murein transglycosylase n=1 Tax=Aceticella autotrophica TaxID=2755338 RepID=A0A974Y495_9THEO|nr:endolytic transglycosylase MltG [Aceticella autotrophica]QSZ26542.1 endolytic transglycosylase MltG [Aceticella autotrophica]
MINVKNKRKKGSRLLIIIVIFFILSSFLYYENLFTPVSNSNIQKIVKIPDGYTTQDIAKVLYSEGLIKNKSFFILRVKANNCENKIKAGKYLLSTNMTTDEIINKLKSGKSQIDTIKFTIPEGFTVEDIANRLSDMGLANKDKFMWEAQNGVFNYDFLKNIPQNRPNRLEGYLFPDTYEISIGTNEHDIIKLMLSRFDNIYQKYIRNNSANIGMNPDQVVIVASMIEKEAKVEKDRPLIAGIIYNRLKKNMKLQIDATVQYALGVHKDKLSYKDLEIKSPYNTYTNFGLPVGPISNPGLKSIEAALYPKHNDYYYYFAKNDGTHVFSQTYRQHLEEQKKTGNH